VNEIWLTNINGVIDGEEGAREGGRERETDMLPKEPWDKHKRKRWESAISHQIAKGSGRGSDEDDASESFSSAVMNLRRLGKHRQKWRPATNPFCGRLRAYPDGVIAVG
jgi:hypothetical protein